MSVGIRLSSVARARLRLTPTDPYAGSFGSTPVLIVPGLRNSGADHWQTLWEAERPEFRRVVQPDWDAVDLEAWAVVLASAVRASAAPPLIVAHSFGCLATVRAAAVHAAPIRAALLVAPADPDRLGVGPLVSRARLPFPSTVIGSTDDPWMKLVKAGELATSWGSQLIGYRNAGHINAESGYGPWPDGLRLLRQLDARAARADAPVALPRANTAGESTARPVASS